MALVQGLIPDFIDRQVHLTDGRIFDIVCPLTDYRGCHNGTPAEARIVFVCKECTPNRPEEEYVLKVKVQCPAEGQLPVQGPSTTTIAEIQALEKFRDTKTSYAPHFVAFHSKAQRDNGPLPGGFITFTIMTKLPGFALFGKYWSMSLRERDEITSRAVEALRAIYTLGIEPGDRGLRNVMWDPLTKHCSIVDFEIWKSAHSTFPDEKLEMQRWGLVRAPPARDHFAAFNAMYRQA